MTTKRPLSWFLTENGRKFSFAVITGAGIALTSAKFVPNTLFLNKYKNFVHYYNNAHPVPLCDELHKQYEKCLDLLQVSDIHKKLITPFSVYGYDLFHAGSCNSRFGALVGIPVNFTYKSLTDLENHDIRVNQKKVDWSTETGQKLADALILPDKVKQFAISREILMTQNNKIIFESTYPFICIFLAYNLSQSLNTRLNLYAGPLYMRATLYAIVGLFCLGCYFLLQDMTEVYYETEVDRKLCKLGSDYIESGIIFYDKLLQRNRALRELMGKEGESKYSKLGNENFGLRQPRLALIHRKRFFEGELRGKTNEEKPDEEEL